jgi:hypothetical protein
MSKPIDPQGAIESMWKIAPEYAKAKAERIYLEEYRKSKKAILMKTVSDLPLGAQEREAYADPEYIGLLAALQTAVEREEMLRWRLVSAQTAVDVWRTTQASNRAIDRAAA